MPMIHPAPTWLKALEAAGQASEGFVIARDRERLMQQRQEALDLDREAFEADKAQAERAADTQEAQFEKTYELESRREERYAAQEKRLTAAEKMKNMVPRVDKAGPGLNKIAGMLGGLGPIGQRMAKPFAIAAKFQDKDRAKAYLQGEVKKAAQEALQQQIELDINGKLWGPEDQQGLQMFATRMAVGEQMDQLAKDYQAARDEKIEKTAKVASLQAEVAEAQAFLGQMKAMTVGSAKATRELNRIEAIFNAGDLKPAEAKIAAIKATSGVEDDEDPDEAILNSAFKAMPDDPEGALELASTWSRARNELLRQKRGGPAQAEAAPAPKPAKSAADAEARLAEITKQRDQATLERLKAHRPELLKVVEANEKGLTGLGKQMREQLETLDKRIAQLEASLGGK